MENPEKYVAIAQENVNRIAGFFFITPSTAENCPKNHITGQLFSNYPNFQFLEQTNAYIYQQVGGELLREIK